jgi:predicted transcriptional regulator
MEQESTPNKIINNSKEIIRAILKIGLMGPIGTAIDELFYGIGERLRAKRVEKLVYYLQEELEKMEIEKVNTEYLKSEEFHDLLLRVIDKSVRTRHDEKIRIFSKILSGSIFSEIPETEDLEDFTEIIANLTMTDIGVLKAFREKEIQLKEEKLASEKPSEFFDLVMAKTIKDKLPNEESDIVFSLSRLNSLGLIKEYYAGSSLGMDGGGCYESTKKLERLMNLLTVE